MEQEIYTSVNDIVRQYDTILIIYGIISIVVLVCFFYLCSNVSKIRNLLEKQYYESHSSFDDKLTLLYELIEKEKRTSLGSSVMSHIK